MPLGSATNFVRQTVGSAVGTTDPETIDVSDASAFADPSVAEYDIVIWDAGSHNRPDQDSNVEVLRVAGRDTGNNTLTCARAQQGTSNVSHPDTSDVIVTPLAEGDFKDVNAQTVTTGQADITNETYVESHLATDNTGISSGTFTNIVDTEDHDVRNEFNSSQQFSPDATGEYRIEAVIWFGSGADGDTHRGRVRNVTDNTGVKSQPLRVPVGAADSVGLPFSEVVPLDSSKNYEVQAMNDDSSFELLGGFGSACYLTITKAVVHP